MGLCLVLLLRGLRPVGRSCTRILVADLPAVKRCGKKTIRLFFLGYRRNQSCCMSGMLFRWDKWLTGIASDWQGPSAQPGVPTESGCGKLGHRPITLADLERKNPFRKRVGKGNTAEKEAEKPQPLRVEVSWFKATPRSTLPDFERVFEEHMTQKPHNSSELHCTTTKTAMRVLLLEVQVRISLPSSSRQASTEFPTNPEHQPCSQRTKRDNTEDTRSQFLGFFPRSV